MKLSIGEIHNLYSSLQRMDGDASLKLKDTTRLAIVINLNKLLPIVQGYENIRQKAYAELRQDGMNPQGIYARDASLFEAQFGQRDRELREAVQDVGLKTIPLDDLKPTKGEHFISGMHWLRPMISDWPED